MVKQWTTITGLVLLLTVCAHRLLVRHARLNIRGGPGEQVQATGGHAKGAQGQDLMT